VADPVEYESRGPVVTLWLNRPEVKNAYDLGLLEALADGLTRAEEDEDARLVVVSAWGSKTRSHLSGSSRGSGRVTSPPIYWRSRVLRSLAYFVVRRLFELIVICCRSSRSKELEILVLRHELSILHRQPRRPQLREADRVFLAALSRALPRRAWSAFSVSPRTLLRWHPAAGGAPLDVPASPARPSACGSRSRGYRHPSRAREHSLGLSADRR
jgi:hypothetical protein